MKFIFVFIIIGILSVAIARFGYPEIINLLAQEKHEEKPTEIVSVPPIDKNLPKKLETATFALG